MDLREELKKVKDPEIGQNIVDLGLVYDVKVKGKVAEVLITLTTPMCPAGGQIMHDVERTIKGAGYECKLELTFEPLWSPELISKDLRRKLGI